MGVASGLRVRDQAVNFVAPGRRIRPLRDQIIVKPLPLQLGQRLRADWSGEVVRGRVVAAGPGCYKNIHRRGIKDGKPWRTVHPSQFFTPNAVKVGDIVQLGGMELGGYLWPKVWAAGDWCVICREEDVCFIEER